MERLGISMPIQLHGRSLGDKIRIVRRDCNGAIEDPDRIRVPPQHGVTQSNLLKEKKIPRIEAQSMFQLLSRGIPMSLPAIDIAQEQIRIRGVRQLSPRGSQLQA